MGSISKRPDGTYRAYARVNNKRKSKLFKRRGDARIWLEQTEQALETDTGNTLYNAIDKYIKDVSSKKKGERWERIRLGNVKRQMPDKPLVDVTRKDIAEWRDRRLQEVSGPTVKREMTLLSSVFNIALNEWEWVTVNPCVGVRKPADSKPRERVFQDSEIEQLSQILPETASLAFLLAIETGLRAGEICKIERGHIQGRVLQVPETKTGNSRTVPLTQTACEILKKAGHSFDITPGSLSSEFYSAKTKLGIDATFHDTRHTAATRLSEKLDVLDLCRMFGWKNVSQALSYYNPKAEDLAKKLD